MSERLETPQEDQPKRPDAQALLSPSVPSSMTFPCLRFFIEDLDAITFVAFTDAAAQHLDDIYKEMAKGATPSADESLSTEIIAHARRGIGAQALVRSYERIVAEMIICRAADNFIAYLAELLALIFRAEPRTLASMDLKFEEVLDHPELDELVAVLAEKRVSQLSRDSFSELSAYFEKAHKITLIDDLEKLKRITYFIALRNLIVHNRRIADSKFARQSGEATVQIGQVVPMTDDVFGVLELLREAVAEIDERVATKYKIERPHSDRDFWGVFTALRRMGDQQTTPEARDAARS